jgi:DNA-binding HxlR family transcriptional regulator
VDVHRLQELSKVIGHKWDLVILAHLRESRRYSELKREILESASDLADGVLNKELRRLRNAGFVARVTLGGVDHYALSAYGRHVVTILAQIAELQLPDDQGDPEPSPSQDSPNPTDQPFSPPDGGEKL